MLILALHSLPQIRNHGRNPWVSFWELESIPSCFKENLRAIHEKKLVVHRRIAVCIYTRRPFHPEQHEFLHHRGKIFSNKFTINLLEKIHQDLKYNNCCTYTTYVTLVTFHICLLATLYLNANFHERWKRCFWDCHKTMP